MPSELLRDMSLRAPNDQIMGFANLIINSREDESKILIRRLLLNLIDLVYSKEYRSNNK